MCSYSYNHKSKYHFFLFLSLTLTLTSSKYLHYKASFIDILLLGSKQIILYKNYNSYEFIFVITYERLLLVNLGKVGLKYGNDRIFVHI